mmetsp:Transcript_44574/g.121464  ORF Transcript_44574/g.121464 Transcript_44574/m.121464 type:complete len:256 (+) Transcript_44574:367-1134(+)
MTPKRKAPSNRLLCLCARCSRWCAAISIPPRELMSDACEVHFVAFREYPLPDHPSDGWNVLHVPPILDRLVEVWSHLPQFVETGPRTAGKVMVLDVTESVKVQQIPQRTAAVRHRRLHTDLVVAVLDGVAEVLHDPESHQRVTEKSIPKRHGEEEVPQRTAATVPGERSMDHGHGDQVGAKVAELADVVAPIAQQAVTKRQDVEHGQTGANNTGPEHAAEGRVKCGGRALPRPKERVAVNVSRRACDFVVPFVPA